MQSCLRCCVRSRVSTVKKKKKKKDLSAFCSSPYSLPMHNYSLSMLVTIFDISLLSRYIIRLCVCAYVSISVLRFCICFLYTHGGVLLSLSLSSTTFNFSPYLLSKERTQLASRPIRSVKLDRPFRNRNYTRTRLLSLLIDIDRTLLRIALRILKRRQNYLRDVSGH